MKILFISIENEANHIRDLLQNERHSELIELPTDSPAILQTFRMEKPYAVVMRFLGAYSHALALHMRNTRIPARFITYTYDKAYARVKEMSLHKYDGYFHLDMQPEAILCVFRKVMMGYTMLEYNEYEL